MLVANNSAEAGMHIPDKVLQVAEDIEIVIEAHAEPTRRGADRCANPKPELDRSGPKTRREKPTTKRLANWYLPNWGGRTRTSNFPVNSRAVCQLTYTPSTAGVRCLVSGTDPRTPDT
jgi:hypothetical protein